MRCSVDTHYVIQLSLQSCDVGVIIYILQMRKPKLREAMYLARGHTAHAWQSLCAARARTLMSMPINRC